MGKSILCPYCFETFDNTEVMVQCDNFATRTVDGKPKENSIDTKGGHDIIVR